MGMLGRGGFEAPLVYGAGPGVMISLLWCLASAEHIGAIEDD